MKTSGLRDYLTIVPFFLFGAFLIFFAAVMFVQLDHSKSFKKCDSVVTSAEVAEPEHYEGEDLVEATYHVIVKYTVDGKEYENHLGDMPGVKVGDNIKIAYNPDDPNEIMTPYTVIWPILLGAAGIVLIIVGVVCIIRNKKYKNIKQEEFGNV
ncbi:MAG: DUF3592 domain-containing protein [Lachnospiraceae bacterium]|nr:DUF3592 domain-containing protein [Lachnospiraceae bacterium]